MTKRSFSRAPFSRVIVALLAAGSLLAVAPSAEAANLEAELGVGLFTGLEDGADLDAGWLGRVGLVAGLSDRSALELTATRIEAKDLALLPICFFFLLLSFFSSSVKVILSGNGFSCLNFL